VTGRSLFKVGRRCNTWIPSSVRDRPSSSSSSSNSESEAQRSPSSKVRCTSTRPNESVRVRTSPYESGAAKPGRTRPGKPENTVQRHKKQVRQRASQGKLYRPRKKEKNIIRRTSGRQTVFGRSGLEQMSDRMTIVRTIGSSERTYDQSGVHGQ